LIKNSNFYNTYIFCSINDHKSTRLDSWEYFPAKDDKNQPIFIRLRSEDDVQYEVPIYIYIKII